ncbi:hypothetical protein ALC57_05487 [Trachymyrmex cornetzi]|uniref:Uncharacterized protein n=1 Tax=Trachymyrmex cornetzi TaxID=471704 RepID=A0A151JB11_9HYME|nr:hypothetical protein ALC57_05487 [Trachymyrmex cornetzi]
MNRKIVHKIINEITNSYLSNLLTIISNRVNDKKDLNAMLNILINGFKMFKTEHLTFTYLKKINCLFVPSKIAIRSYLTSGRIKKRVKTVLHNSTLSIIFLKDVLKKFLELPNVYSSILSHIEECKNSQLFTFFDSEYWKKVENEKENRIVLPLVLYFDDVEINNPLGSRKCIHKIGIIYSSILGLPYEFSSMLESIFLVQIHNYQDHKVLGNKRIFQHVVNQIINLQENGIIISINNQEYKIFFILPFIIGDNLGLNTILGYSRNFRSNYCCRICYGDISNLKKQSVENISELRTQENYLSHLRNQSFGIQEECIFNSISNFHVIDNVSVDPMHDILEGICRYDLAKILRYFIDEKQFFTLEILNKRILFFDHISSNKNIPPNLSCESIKKGMIILSASEMKFLIENLNFIIGDLIPKNNCTWKLYLILSDILHITSISTITLENIERFNSLTSEYIKLNLKLFKTPLKIKHHHLVHYSRLMKKFGPLNNMSSIRYEAKHKQVKEYSKVITSRKNACYTLSLKHQLQLRSRFVHNF